jgi:homoserine kinase
MEWIKVFSPATIGNVGPGFDVLGLSVKNMGDIVEARKIEEGVIISSLETEMPLSIDATKNTAGIAAQEVLKLLRVQGGVELKIKKGMPSGSGLGSSAASACAAAYATNYLYGNILTKEELILPATKAEEQVSGAFFADNTAPCLLGGATLTRSCLPLDVTKIGYISNLLIILVTPAIVVLTKDARDILPKEVSMQNFIFNMANSCLITAAFAKDDYSLFARSLHDAIIEPARASLIKGFMEVKANALKAGADGMTISGSGPTVFAITNDSKKARFIEDAMLRTFSMHGVEAKSLITEVDNEGTRLL